VIADVDEAGHRSWYTDVPAGTAAGGGVPAGTPATARPGDVLRRADVERYLAERADALGFISRLLESSSLTNRRGQFACFGLHEWAMVHRLEPGRQRHEDLPLRLSQQATDAVVEKENLVCSDID